MLCVVFGNFCCVVIIGCLLCDRFGFVVVVGCVVGC